MPTPPLADRLESAIIREPNTGCWLWVKAVSIGGYGQIGVNRKVEVAHRVSYRLYVGPIPSGALVLHKCDTPACINPGHLFLGTHKINYDDMTAKGRRASFSGEHNSNVKLTFAQVEEIRASGLTQVELAKMYGVNQPHVSRIKRRAAWA